MSKNGTSKACGFCGDAFLLRAPDRVKGCRTLVTDAATVFSLPDGDLDAARRGSFNGQTMKKNVKWRGEVPLPFSQPHCCPVTDAPGNV